MPYPFYVNKLYKIWFSKDKNVFLPYLNQLRLKKCRADNPRAVITLIYSQSCLSEKAQLALKHFCKRNNIVSVDFDCDIYNELFLEKHIHRTHSKSNQDFEVSKIVQSEIKHTLNNTGGNLAAASDALRLVARVIQNYGLYTDFDVEVKLKEFDYLLASSFFMLYGEYIERTHQTEIFFSNEVMAFSRTADGVLHQDSIDFIAKLQCQLFANYQQEHDISFAVPGKHIGISADNVFKLREKLQSVHCLREYFELFYSEIDFGNDIKNASDEKLIQIYINDSGIQYEILTDLEKLIFDKNPAQYLQEHMLDCLDLMYKDTVLNVSGPNMMAPLLRTLGDVSRPYTFSKLFVQYSALLGCFKGNVYNANIVKSELFDVNMLREMPNNNDASWTRTGQEIFLNRSKDAAALAILHWWREKRSRIEDRVKINESNENLIEIRKIKRKLY